MVFPKFVDITANCISNSQCSNQLSSDKHVLPFEGDYNHFFHQFLTSNQPVVIPNVASKWKCSQLWVKNGLPNIDFLRTRYGDALVSVADCNKKYFNAQLKNDMTFYDFATYWSKIIQNKHQSAEHCFYLKDWHFTKDFPSENMYIVPFQFCSDWLNEYFTSHPYLNDDYRFVYMGPKGSWTPFHVDVFTSYSWSVNICGEKRWILLEPGEENKLKDELGNLPYDISCLEDANNNISDANVRYRIIIQKPGDAVFIPSGWYHQVWNTRDTISINHNWVNGCNIEHMWKSMKINFEDVKHEIAEFRDSMDDWHGHCQLLLKSCFGMDFKDFYKFIKFILRRRKQCIETKTELEVYGDWLLGCNHIDYDFTKANLVCRMFESDPDVRILFDERILTSS